MSHNQDYKVWQKAEVSQAFLTGVRGAIPLAKEQIEIILRLINLTQSKVNKFLDLGCGDGVLGKAIYQDYPDATGFFLDLSDDMIQATRNNIGNQYKSHFITQNFANNNWTDSLIKDAPFDVIVSGFAIHHQPDHRKQEIYQEIYQILKPGGLFLNLEHIASYSKLGEQAFDQLFVDSLYAFHQDKNPHKSREEIDKQYYSRADKTANILTLVETQCEWLRNIGFVDVDCFMKIFEIGLFGGIRPK